MQTKTVNITGIEQFGIEINKLISKGWKVQSVQASENFKIKLIKESEYGYRNKHSKIPILNSLQIRMLRKMAGRLGLKDYSYDLKNVLISKIEQYKTPYVMDVYNKLTNLK